MGADVHAGSDLVVVQSLSDEPGDGLLGVGEAVPAGDGPGGGRGPVAAADAELAQPPPDAGLVAVGAGLAVSVEGGFEVPDGLVPGRAGEEDGEVFGGGGFGPRVGVLCRGLAEKARVAGGEALAVRRGRGQSREPRVGVGEGHGGAGDLVGQGLVTGRERGAYQPGRKSRVAGQQSLVCRETGTGLADMADGGGRAVARFGDLGLGQGGLGPRVRAGEMRHRGGKAGDVLGRARDVAAAQRDHSQNAVRGRGVPVSS